MLSFCTLYNAKAKYSGILAKGKNQDEQWYKIIIIDEEFSQKIVISFAERFERNGKGEISLLNFN